MMYHPPQLRALHVQTESYLEELTDVVPEAEAGTQTDELPARPPSPTFVPAKVGVDTTTQIEEGDLFDFDREVMIVPQSEPGSGYSCAAA